MQKILLLEFSNLQRQILFNEEDVINKTPKVIAAVDKLKKINSNVDIELFFEKVDKKNIEKLIRGFDIVLDSTDNFSTRYIINEACIKNKIPFIYGAVAASFGMIYNVIPGSGTCLQCLFKKEPGDENTLNCI